jgi:PPOX class probable F420-dependent enzyme
MKLSREEIHRFLVATVPAPLATVATVRPDGSPNAVPVWFLWEAAEARFVIMGQATSRWIADLERDARITVAVAEQSPPNSTVIARGRAGLRRTSKSDSLPTLERLTKRYLTAERVGPYIEDLADTEMVIVTVAPTSFTTWTFEFPSS